MDQGQQLEYVRDVLLAVTAEYERTDLALGNTDEVQAALQIIAELLGEQDGDSTAAEDSAQAGSEDDVSTEQAVHADADGSVGDAELTEV